MKFTHFREKYVQNSEREKFLEKLPLEKKAEKNLTSPTSQLQRYFWCFGIDQHIRVLYSPNGWIDFVPTEANPLE